jgi:PhoH-like ATPase
MPAEQRSGANRLFVLDTNVLIHDPASLFRFEEHDIFLPMMVMEELDHHKRGPSEVARNARQASRFLDEMVEDCDRQSIDEGVQLPSINNGHPPSGKLFFQTHLAPMSLPESLPGGKPDNDILGVTLALQNQYPGRDITLVTKDINLRIKATILGINAEDYFNDRVLDDASLLYPGESALPADFWEQHQKDMESWAEEGRTFYRLSGPEVEQWFPNQFLYHETDGFEAIVRSVDGGSAVIEHVHDFRGNNHAVWGITARNREQNYALNLLMDPEVDFVTLLGHAGTGKTLLTLAAGLKQALEDSRYTEIIVTRATIPVGEDIGFLPGTEEEKMNPWMGALMDNLEVLAGTSEGGSWGRAATTDLLMKRIRIHSMNFMRGRTFLNKFVIIDEAQNLTSKQMKTLVTRAGPGTKVICLGNIAQIDTPYLTETTSGLTYVVDRFKNWEHSGHITLMRGERSRLADFATEVL